MVLDIWIERADDSVKYKDVDMVRIAGQKEFDIRNMPSQLKNVTKLRKLDPNNTEILS